MKEAFDWTLQIMDLPCRLDSVLLNMVEAWKSFNLPNNGIGYLCDITAISPNVRRSLCTIEAVFQRLQENQKKMVL